jgi:predicted anti-sigma-YlaC factor YlaD
MDHARAQELFSDYHDGELAEAAREEVANHLGACELCRGEYQRFTAAVQAMSALRSDAPGDFVGSVQGQIRRRSRGRFFARPAPRFAQVTLSLITQATLGLAIVLYYLVASP